jgi:hypothetical protein
MLGAGTGFATVYMAIMVGLPLGLRADHAAAAWPGILIAVAATTAILGRRLPLTRAPDPFARMRTGYALLAAGLALAALVGAVHAHVAWYLPPWVVWSLGSTVLLGEPFAVVAGLAEEADRGRYLAAYGVSWGVATTAAPPVATGLVAAGGSALLWAGCAAGAAALALAQSRVRCAVSDS